MVNNLCVIGNSLYNYPIALVLPNPKVIEKLAKCSKSSTSPPYTSPVVRRHFLAKLTAFARANGLRKYEIPREVILVEDDWTPESGLVTASFKLKRKNIEQHYAEQIRLAFSKMD